MRHLIIILTMLMAGCAANPEKADSGITGADIMEFIVRIGNAAKETGLSTYHTPMDNSALGGDVSSSGCRLISKSRSGLNTTCTYKCPSGNVSRTINGGLCPL